MIETSISNEEAFSPIRFTPPPLCFANKRNQISKGDAIVFVDSKGGKIKGSLISTEINPRHLQIAASDDDEPLLINYSECKLISLPGLRQWINLPSNTPQLINDNPYQELNFKINFNDGDKLTGKTLGFDTDRNGLYLFPTQKKGYFTYIFIPHAAIKHKQIGLKIGAQLVEDKAVSTEIVDSALEKQDQHRKQKLGDYLTQTAVVTSNELEKALKNQINKPNIKLGEILLQENLITQEQLEVALEEQKQNRSIPLGKILLKHGEITSEQLQKSLSNKLGIPFVDVSKIDIDYHALAILPEKIARQYCVLPLSLFNKKLIVAVEDPLDWEMLEAIRFASNTDVIPVMAFADEIHEAIEFHYSMEVYEPDQIEEEIETLEEDSKDEFEVSDNVIVRLANKIIIDAYNKGASDIHIEPNSDKQKTRVRLRKDGTLISYHSVSPKLRRTLVARYKIMAGMDTTDRRRPQDGKINFGRFSRLKIELRAMTIPTAGQEEDLVMRILASGKTVALEEMKLEEDNINCIKHVLKSPHGLFFVSGPTGSGKTTLLHALLSHLNTSDRKIWTVEDPVEIMQKGLRQVQVNSDIGLDFPAVLRSLLRGDPDIIMVGEMRDEETTKMGIEASLTGHLVLSTLHTNGAAESVTRLLEMGMDPYNFSDALLGVVAQRLTQKLCVECKQPVVANNETVEKMLSEYCSEYEKVDATEKALLEREKLSVDWRSQFANDRGEFSLYKAEGCKACDNTGYNGRIAIHEMLMISPALRIAIYRKAPVTELLKMALLEGMTTLKQDGIRKVLKGYTDMKQIRKVCAS